jgi:hypothetical protein
MATRMLNVTDAIFEISEPGDSTSYQMLALRISGEVQCGELGRVSDGWLVVCGLNNRAYLFQNDGYLSEAYVAEKLALKNPVSVKRVTEQVARLLNREAIP